MTHTLIYPHTTVHNAAGHLEIGGCDVVELTREFGTPLFIYDEQTLRDQCRAYHAAFARAHRTTTRSSTPARRSAAAPWCSSCSRRTSRLTWPAAASWPWPAPPASRPRASTSTATTRRRPRSRPGWTPASATSWWIRSRRSSAWRRPRRAAAASRRCWCASRRACAPAPTTSCRPASRTASSAWPGRRQGRRGGAPPARGARIWSWSACTPTSAPRSSIWISYRREVEVLFVAIDDWRRDVGFRVPGVQHRRRPWHPLHAGRPAQLHRRVRRR